MSKKVIWGQAKISSAKRAPGSYGSFRELLEKSNALQKEQAQAEEYLRKCMPAMAALLEYKFKNNEPLVIMRPLRYQTSELDGDNDGFYKSSGRTKFVDVIKTIMPGTQLMLKSLDVGLQEFVFLDGAGNEISMNFCERNNLMTQTDIFETVKQFLEARGE